MAIHEGVRVRALVHEHGRVAGLRTTIGDVQASTVVLCAGIWTRQIALAAGVAVPIQPVEHHYVLSPELGPELDALPVVRDPDGCIYYRGRDSRIMLGAFQPVSKPWLVDQVPDDFAFRLLDADWEHFGPPLAEGLRRIPRLRSLGIETFVNGPEGFTPDGNPLVGAVPDLSGLYVCAGFNSSGLAYGGGVGEALAEWILAGEPPFDLWAIDVQRFSPEHGGRDFLRARGVEVLGTHMRLAHPNVEWEQGRDLRHSPLHERLAARGACFGEKFGVERANWFAGTGERPAVRYSFGRQNWFENVGTEHLAARERAAIFDVSSFGKFSVQGPDAAALLQRACANDVDVEEGRVVYTAMLTRRGTFASDLTVTRIGAEHFVAVTGTGQRASDRAWLRRQIAPGERVELVDVSDDWAVLAVMGPFSREILGELCDTDLAADAFPFMTSREVRIGGVPCRAVRITYVGELGWELHVARDRAAALYDAIRRSASRARLVDAGYYAINSLRLEKGYRQWGSDITCNDTPLEAGLAFAVAWDTDFHGRKALVAERDSGPPHKRLVSVTLDDPDGVLWGGELIFRDGGRVGHTTSGAYGHSIAAAVGLGYLHLEEPVTEQCVAAGSYEMDVAGKRVPARASLRAFLETRRERVVS